MAEYTQPDVVNKRVRFFDGQYLQDQDFIDEQKFHLDRERRLARALQVRGIVSGLEVSMPGRYQVRVTPGIAIDAGGRVLILESELVVRLPENDFKLTQGNEVQLAYDEVPTDLAKTGSESERRWQERPKALVISSRGAAAAAPDGATTQVSGATVLLAKVAVSDNGTVTIDRTVSRRSGLSVYGAIGVGTDDPVSDIELGRFDQRDRYLTFKVSGGNQQRSGVKMWAWQDNYGYSLEYDERVATGNGLHIRTHDRTPDGTTRLFVSWNGGHVGIGTTAPDYKLTVSDSTNHVLLRREKTETAGGKQIFLELYQDDPSVTVPEVFPSIRFHHGNRFWHRLEARGDGFHFKDGWLGGDTYKPVTMGALRVNGALNVTGSGGVNVDMIVNGRMRSDNNDGGMWVASDRFVGGHSTNQLGLWNGNQWRLTVQQNGQIGIGTLDPGARLGVSATNQHVLLRRESTETTGGEILFLELLQMDPNVRVPEVYPNIRFHHNNRFWHRLEARGDGFHLREGWLQTTQTAVPGYVGLRVGNLRIGDTIIYENELKILKRLAAGQMSFDLYNIDQDEYIYAADYAPYDNDRRRCFTWRPGGYVAPNGRWRIDRPS